MTELLMPAAPPATATDLARPRVSTTTGGATRHPAGLIAFAVGICVGGWLGGAAGLFLGLVCSLGVIATAARWPALREVIENRKEARAKRLRDFERERRLQLAGPVRRAEFAEISSLADEIEASDPAQARRLDLQDLLDYYIQLALSHQRVVDALQRGDRAPLWQASGTARPSGDLAATSRWRHDIMVRRLEHRDACRSRAAELANELDAVAEFVHLVSEVTTCPLVDEGMAKELERRLWELEVQQTALRQLAG